MATKLPSFTELTHLVVQESKEPLPFNSIFQRVDELRQITTKNPKSTIRNAINQSRLIATTGDGRYGWKPRMINGSIIRHILSEDELSNFQILFSDELREALYPTFFEIKKRKDLTPITLHLPIGKELCFPLKSFGAGDWGTIAEPVFWDWLKSVNAKNGDSLVVYVVDGEAKLYSVDYEAQSIRNEDAISERNQTIKRAITSYTKKRNYGVIIWDIVAHLLATGQYQNPIPPEPISVIWPVDILGREQVGDKIDIEWALYDRTPKSPMDEIIDGLLSRYEEIKSSGNKEKQLSILMEVFNAANNAMHSDYDPDNPPDLPEEYQPLSGFRSARQSLKGQHGPVISYTLHVNHRALPDVWREIEMAEDQTLEDLHLMIQEAFEWDDDHLYSFFMSGKRGDRESEIGSPWSDSKRHTHQVTIENLDLKEEQVFLYLFDYGDNHEFDVRVVKINPIALKGAYPKIVGIQGDAPPQYPDFDEYTGESGWDPHAHW